jgi:hypothetical protein
MRIIAFLTDYAVVDRIINHLKLTFVAERPSTPQIVYQELFMAAEERSEWFGEPHPLFSIDFGENLYLIAGCSALSAVLCLFLVLDSSVLGVTGSFQDVSGWKSQGIKKDFWQSQKGISYS